MSVLFVFGETILLGRLEAALWLVPGAQPIGVVINPWRSQPFVLEQFNLLCHTTHAL